ncbi:uncharacterized protein LOC112002224 [Quercus suber]|uniref:uncharacterized protein LOC112002224 n=1 Tax=Quercus suber TaxID=58331 RepID=UPI0032DFA5E5
MITLSWNCRGLGNRRTVRALEKVVSSQDPSLIFLMETKMCVSEMDGIKETIDRPGGLVVPSKGRSGGLALLWKRDIRVEVQTFSENHIDAIIVPGRGSPRWRLTGFYGNPETSKREESWSLLTRLANGNSLPWLCIGDFNELMQGDEKEGGSTRPVRQMASFCIAVNESQLRDLGYVGQKFTWCRRMGDRGWVRERLDRALVSTAWAQHFPTHQLFHIANSASDHCILVLKDTPPRCKPRQRKKLFRFESMWINDESCSPVVEEAWAKGMARAPISPYSCCLEECRSALASWNSSTFGHVGKKIANLQRSLQDLESQKDNNHLLEEIEDTRRELNKLLDMEEAMWHQRTHISWLKQGDRNTSFFHTKASSSEELIDAIHPKVSAHMNSFLTRDFRAEEVTRALKQMFPTTAPGPDGMPPLFYQQYWPTVGKVITETVLDFLNVGITPLNFNETHIVLIPKVKDPKHVQDFRPISLCNVAYKLASKILANRLKPFLPTLVCENQSAFVAERLITDNILVASETMFHISQKRKGKVGEMALKLDMSKAYDRVEWKCLEQIMVKLGID